MYTFSLLFLRMLSIWAFLLGFGLSSANAQVKLEFMWKLDGFDRPESLFPSADHSEIYVSNINGASNEEDGNGYISRVSLDGEVIEKKWITGLDGPKGFVVDQGKIYITDVKDVVIIDLASGNIEKRIAVPDVGFLNDLAVVNGQVFFSDTGADKLYRYTEEDGLSTIASGEKVDGINGLLANGEDLLITVTRAGKLLSVDLDDYSMTEVGAGIINGDGIGILESGGYTITSFTGEIYYIKNETETELLLDSKPDEISQNDSYLIGDTLFVANINPGSVTAWKVVGVP